MVPHPTPTSLSQLLQPFPTQTVNTTIPTTTSPISAIQPIKATSWAKWNLRKDNGAHNHWFLSFRLRNWYIASKMLVTRMANHSLHRLSCPLPINITSIIVTVCMTMLTYTCNIIKRPHHTTLSVIFHYSHALRMVVFPSQVFLIKSLVFTFWWQFSRMYLFIWIRLIKTHLFKL